MRRYIIFQAESGDTEGWEARKLEHTQALTDILTEYWDSSNKPIPELGYRPLEFICVDGLHNPKRHGDSTHYRLSDWEVVRVETYTSDIPTPASTFDEIVLCYCQYLPIDAPLKPMPERQVSPDSFGEDEEAYQRWLESEQGKSYAELTSSPD